ncbi:putative phage-like protein YoqJ [Paenibacillus sp. DS2015]
MITPGQYGVDLWACEAVIALKEQYPSLKLSIMSAYLNPEEKWKEDKKDYYNEILLGVDYYGIVSKQTYQGTWQFIARDDLLFRKTDGILLIYDEDAGEGSPKFMKDKALKKHNQDGYVYLNITSEDIQSIADEENDRSFD